MPRAFATGAGPRVIQPIKVQLLRPEAPGDRPSPDLTPARPALIPLSASGVERQAGGPAVTPSLYGIASWALQRGGRGGRGVGEEVEESSTAPAGAQAEDQADIVVPDLASHSTAVPLAASDRPEPLLDDTDPRPELAPPPPVPRVEAIDAELLREDTSGVSGGPLVTVSRDESVINSVEVSSLGPEVGSAGEAAMKGGNSRSGVSSESTSVLLGSPGGRNGAQAPPAARPEATPSWRTPGPLPGMGAGNPAYPHPARASALFSVEWPGDYVEPREEPEGGISGQQETGLRVSPAGARGAASGDRRKSPVLEREKGRPLTASPLTEGDFSAEKDSGAMEGARGTLGGKAHAAPCFPGERPRSTAPSQNFGSSGVMETESPAIHSVIARRPVNARKEGESSECTGVGVHGGAGDSRDAHRAAMHAAVDAVVTTARREAATGASRSRDNVVDKAQATRAPASRNVLEQFDPPTCSVGRRGQERGDGSSRGSRGLRGLRGSRDWRGAGEGASGPECVASSARLTSAASAASPAPPASATSATTATSTTSASSPDRADIAALVAETRQLQAQCASEMRQMHALLHVALDGLAKAQERPILVQIGGSAMVGAAERGDRGVAASGGVPGDPTQTYPEHSARAGQFASTSRDARQDEPVQRPPRNTLPFDPEEPLVDLYAEPRPVGKGMARKRPGQPTATLRRPFCPGADSARSARPSSERKAVSFAAQALPDAAGSFDQSLYSAGSAPHEDLVSEALRGLDSRMHKSVFGDLERADYPEFRPPLRPPGSAGLLERPGVRAVREGREENDSSSLSARGSARVGASASASAGVNARANISSGNNTRTTTTTTTGAAQRNTQRARRTNAQAPASRISRPRAPKPDSAPAPSSAPSAPAPTPAPKTLKPRMAPRLPESDPTPDGPDAELVSLNSRVRGLEALISGI